MKTRKNMLMLELKLKREMEERWKKTKPHFDMTPFLGAGAEVPDDGIGFKK